MKWRLFYLKVKQVIPRQNQLLKLWEEIQTDSEEEFIDPNSEEKYENQSNQNEVNKEIISTESTKESEEEDLNESGKILLKEDGTK